MPLFPELRPYLEEAYEMAEPGAVHVITRWRDTHKNLRTQLMRIIRRTGLVPWPRLFQNLLRQPWRPPNWPSGSRCAL